MISDAQLVARARGGADEEAFRLIVERYQAAIRGFLRRLLSGDHSTADDLAQDTFLLAYRKLHTLRNARGLASWLHSIAYRQFLQHTRKHGRTRLAEEPPDAGHDPRDATTARRDVPDYVAGLERDHGAFRVGLIEEFFGDDVAPGIKAGIEKHIDEIVAEGVGLSFGPDTLAEARNRGFRPV